MQPSVVAISATCGRNWLMKRCLSFFLNQDYTGHSTLLIYNNSEIPYELELENKDWTKSIILINYHISLETGEKYKNLGEIYRDAIQFVPDDIDIISMLDDDDVYLPNHISEGVKGYLKAKEQGKIAYKPAKSYYRDANGTQLTSNTLEPSIFVEAQHIKKYGFSDTTTEQHLQWVNPLIKEEKILVDPEGVPTLIYDWSHPMPTFKTSGDCHNPNNFNNYRQHSQQFGDGILSPLPMNTIKKYYNIK